MNAWIGRVALSTKLRTPNGTMHGHYFCGAEDGERFEVEIPPFVLEDGTQRGLH